MRYVCPTRRFSRTVSSSLRFINRFNQSPELKKNPAKSLSVSDLTHPTLIQFLFRLVLVVLRIHLSTIGFHQITIAASHRLNSNFYPEIRKDMMNNGTSNNNYCASGWFKNPMFTLVDGSIKATHKIYLDWIRFKWKTERCNFNYHEENWNGSRSVTILVNYLLVLLDLISSWDCSEWQSLHHKQQAVRHHSHHHHQTSQRLNSPSEKDF